MSTWIDKDGRRHVGVMLRGRRVHRILPPGATASDAKRVEAEIRSALGAQREPSIPGDPPMVAIMGLYIEHAKTLRSPDTAIFHALRVGPWAEKYRASQARECAAHMLRDMRGVYAAATINRSLGALKKALALAWERGLTPENYGLRVKRVPEHNQRDMALTMEQIERLAAAASHEVARCIWLAVFTGCRRGELLALQPGDVTDQTITIRAGNTKTLRTRIIPVIPQARKHLQGLPVQLTAEGLKTGFRRAREAAEMPWVTFHDLRRTCATLMIQAGVDLYVVSKLLGHSTVAVTQQRYAHLQTDQLRAGLERTFAPEIAQAGKQKRPRKAA